MILYISIFIILTIASFIYLKLAIKFKIIDKPNQRSSHTKITVRGGGIIFPIAILLFFFFNDYEYPYFVLGVFLISFVSFLDDIYTLSSKFRFPFQFLAIFLILYQVGLPFSPLHLWGLYLFIGIGIINMFNFMDGINGITGIYSMTVLSGLYFINLDEHLVNEDLIVFSILSLLIFGFYNFRKKALFFAGDIGSIAIGVLIFFIGFLFAIKLSSPLILLLIIVYGADVACTVFYRMVYTNESIFEPHRYHVYQKIADIYKISHLKISVTYGVLQLIVNWIVFKTYKLDLPIQFSIFFGLVFLLILIYVILFRVLRKKNC
ncbi:MAG: UDP-GlcNAc--UDP-phosphate GlcNAc-1-phosphate transferase [Polaribacter sp.]|uniref:UDP-GlcNAc--UDP-phosphate GlcNAc-1-phosphate transferase n=1 Tax=Polaribacter sp. TaxID=1920175 RepID=UPI002F35E2FA